MIVIIILKLLEDAGTLDLGAINLKITIPSQQEGQHILVETEPLKLCKWLGSLPLGNMSKALPELTRAISSLNRTELNYKKRAELVDQFDSTYQIIHDYFRPKLLSNNKEATFQHDNILRFARLTKEMAFAHKIIVNDCLKKKRLWGKKKIVTKAMAFSIFYLGLMLNEQYERYAPVPMYIWREINALYARAGKEQIERQIIDNQDSYCLPTIEQNYVRNCLMALAAPYCLAAGEHWHIFHYLQHWNHLAFISEDPDDFREDACFVIDVTSDSKPMFVTQELDDPEDPKIRLLITHDIIRQAEFDRSKFLEKSQLPNKSFHPSINAKSADELWLHMCRHWKNQIERKDQRYIVASKVDLIWGIDNICKILQASSQNKTSLSLQQLKEITQIEREELITWKVTNVSTRGIGLVSSHFLISDIQLGNLVLIREYMDNKPASIWRLAICRWHTGDENSGTMLGLKYIDGQANPARLVLHQGKNQKGGQPAIAITNLEPDLNANMSSSIIAASGSSQSNRVYALLGLQQAVEIRPRKVIEKTPCVDHFHYQVYELREELAKTVDKQIDADIPWTSIPYNKDDLDGADDSENHIKTLDNIVLPGDH